MDFQKINTMIPLGPFPPLNVVLSVVLLGLRGGILFWDSVG
jgi:hypothetical protein